MALATETGNGQEPDAIHSIALLPLMRLFQLSSASLPTGGFAYSQGLEWAVETGWINTAEELQRWLSGLMHHAMTRTDVPLLARLYDAACKENLTAFCYWADYVIAIRETLELRMEERNRGRALARLLKNLEPDSPVSHPSAAWFGAVSGCHLAGVALASAIWQIPPLSCVSGYLWNWLESQVLSGVKIIPLGQTAGQQILLRLSGLIPKVAHTGLLVDDEGIGESLFRFAIAGCRHETQRTRLFRS